MAAGTALVDSGANENFIDFHTAQRWKVGIRQMDKPRKIYNADGTENVNGVLNKYCWLRVYVGKQHKLQKFYVTNLGIDWVILGYPWLKEFNPPLDWEAGELGGNLRILLETQWF